jgi:hypothetical protein
VIRVLAITNARDVAALGRRRGAVRAITVGPLAALVMPARKPPAATPANLRTHHHLIASLADDLPAILPARFGTTLDEAELAMTLRLRAGSLAASLRRVRGRSQMTIRIAGVTSPPAEAGVSRPQSGAAYLRARASRERLPGFEPVQRTLARWVREERVERRGSVASVYHLVPRRSVAAYLRAAQRALAGAGLRSVISGPFPPYAFTQF